MDWGRIHDAADARKRELELTLPELAQRAGVDVKTLTNLMTKSVSDGTLRKTSRALNWPPDALSRVGQGEDPGVIPDEPWIDEESLSLQRRLDALEAKVSENAQLMRRLVADIERLTKLEQREEPR